MRKAIIKGMDDLFLEMVSPWVRGDDFLAIIIGNIEIAEAEHVHFDPSCDQGDFWFFMLGNTWRGMQSNGVPDDVDGRLEIPCCRRNSRAALALSTSNRSVALRYSFVRPMSWNMAPI